MDRVQDPTVLECIADKDEILFIFDALIADYAYMKYSIHGEEFKATLSKYDIL